MDRLSYSICRCFERVSPIIVQKSFVTKPCEEKNSNLIKVGPYGDIELSQGQINRLITILRSENKHVHVPIINGQ